MPEPTSGPVFQPLGNRRGTFPRTLGQAAIIGAGGHVLTEVEGLVVGQCLLRKESSCVSPGVTICGPTHHVNYCARHQARDRQSSADLF